MRKTPFIKKTKLKWNKGPQKTLSHTNLYALRTYELQAVGFIPFCLPLCVFLSSCTLPMLQEPAGILTSTTILPSQHDKNATWTTSITSHIRSRIFIHNKFSWRWLVWCCLMYLHKTEILKRDIKLITKSVEAGPCKVKAQSLRKRVWLLHSLAPLAGYSQSRTCH